MKLCIVSAGDFFSNYGGGQVYVRNLVDEIILHHTEVALSVISYNNTLPSILRERVYHNTIVYECSTHDETQALIQKLQPDIIHTHGEKAFIAKLCKDMGIPCVITAHHGGILCPAGGLLTYKDKICHNKSCHEKCLPCYLRNIRTGLFWYPLLRHIREDRYIRLGRRLHNLHFIPFITPIGEAAMAIREKNNQWQTIHENADIIIAPSHAIADSMILNGATPKKIHVVPHGIPTHNWSTTETNNIQPPIQFYYIGRICHEKGIHILLQAFSQLTHHNIKLHLIGTGSKKTERIYMNKLQKRYQHDKRIIWHGPIPSDQVSEVIRPYHVLIHPTICMEVFGLTIAEALAQNKYVIATRCGGAEMQIQDTQNGILVSPNNVEELQAAMEEYLIHPRISNAPVTSIMQHVNELFTCYNKLFEQR